MYIQNCATIAVDAKVAKRINVNRLEIRKRHKTFIGATSLIKQIYWTVQDEWANIIGSLNIC